MKRQPSMSRRCRLTSQGRFPKPILCSIALTLIAACSGPSPHSPSTNETTQIASTEQEREQEPLTLVQRTERAIFDQIKCEEPPAAGIALSAMLRNMLITRTDDGGDGIVLFVPKKPLHLLGYEIVRLGGWQPAEDGGAMPPFWRGPGTAPPNHLSITVRASAEQVRRKLDDLGVRQGQYVQDEHRFIAGPVVEKGDYSDVPVKEPLQGVATITCSADELDFAPRASGSGARQE